jgi:nucleotide-binding universal stress UspA family protein
MDGRRAGRPVVVGVDGSQPALRAVRWAAREAQRRHVPLLLVRAFPALVPQLTGRVIVSGPVMRDALRELADEQLAAAASAAADEVAGLAIEQHVAADDPIPHLVEQSRSAQLVAIGDRGHGGVHGLLAGSVAVGLAARGGCPVVIVRGTDRTERTDRTEGAVVVGVDGSPVSEAALEFAFEVSALRQAPLRAVHVWSDTFLDQELTPREMWDAVGQEHHLVLAERLAGWAEKYPDVPVQKAVERDRPARVLVEESARAQLLVVGSHGRGNVAGHLLGSVSHAVVHRADCPVAVVRHQTISEPA